MNKSILILAALAMPAFAGTSTQVTPEYSAPAPQQEWQWFAGASAAYLFDYEEVLYTGHVGVKSPWSPGGWNVGFFVEGGFLEDDNNALDVTAFDLDLKVVPVTLNAKFEKAFSEDWSVYAGLGAGSAYTKISSVGIGSDSQWVFTGQAFAGVAYHLNQQAEIYSGARWIYLDDADNYNLDHDWAAELGFRWNF